MTKRIREASIEIKETQPETIFEWEGRNYTVTGKRINNQIIENITEYTFELINEELLLVEDMRTKHRWVYKVI